MQIIQIQGRSPLACIQASKKYIHQHAQIQENS